MTMYHSPADVVAFMPGDLSRMHAQARKCLQANKDEVAMRQDATAVAAVMHYAECNPSMQPSTHAIHVMQHSCPHHTAAACWAQTLTPGNAVDAPLQANTELLCNVTRIIFLHLAVWEMSGPAAMMQVPVLSEPSAAGLCPRA